MVGVVAGGAGDFRDGCGRAEQVADAVEGAGLGEPGVRRHRARMVEKPGDDRENGGVIGEREATLGRDAREEGMELVERLGRQASVAGADASSAGELVIEHEAERPAVRANREAMRHVRRNDEEIAGAGGATAAANVLHSFAGEVEDKLRVIVHVRRDLGFAVPIELQLPEDEAQRVDFNFLNEDGAPCEHRRGRSFLC